MQTPVDYVSTGEDEWNMVARHSLHTLDFIPWVS
jgi:hypothetical protein